LPKCFPWLKSAYIEQKSSNGNGSLASANKQQRINRLKPFRFKPGQSGNPKGRPKSFDAFRELAQAIAKETVDADNADHVAEAILRDWAISDDIAKQKAFIEYAFGKVPDKIETTGLENKTTLVLKFDHERPELAGRN
jgi:hypothetical protein